MWLHYVHAAVIVILLYYTQGATDNKSTQHSGDRERFRMKLMELFWFDSLVKEIDQQEGFRHHA